MSSTPNRRSFVSVMRLDGFKRRLVVLVFLAGTFCIALNTFLFYDYVVGSYQVILQRSDLPPEIIDERYAELYRIWLLLTTITVAVLLVSALWMLFMIHRVTGPMMHFRKVIAALLAGQTDERLQLRRGDEFQDLAAAFNKLIDQLQRRG